MKTICFLLFSIFFCTTSSGQLTLKSEIEKNLKGNNFKNIDSFYKLTGYDFYWIRDKVKTDTLIKWLHTADLLGLDKKDYQYNFIQSFSTGNKLLNAADSINTELRLEDAALHFFTDVKVGNRPPPLMYDGLKYKPATSDIPYLIKQYFDKGNASQLVQSLQPNTPEFYGLLKKLGWFYFITKDPGFKEDKIISKSVTNNNRPLVKRLYQFGVTDTLNYSITSKDLLLKLKKTQKEFDVLNDGILRSTSLQAFNVPLQQRIKEVQYAVNYLRWLLPLRQTSPLLILNIPSAYFMIYDGAQVILDSKTIVGKKTTPTPTLSSTITEVILYPYWMVPNNIATKELLPSIKKNIDFLSAGNYQVINKQGHVVDPYAINWNELSRENFPYILRQSTGCDNSLGIVKFNFYNPFTVYLHDTPGKSLFYINKRYFSHGCMRVEKPIELAHLLLEENSIAIDTLTAKGCINQQAPRVVPVKNKLPIVIIYSTVWYNKEGEIKFYDDVYGKLQ